MENFLRLLLWKVVIKLLAATKGACPFPPSSRTEMTTFDVYVAARPDVNKGHAGILTPVPKFKCRLSPTVQTAFSNLLTEDVLQ